MEDVNQRFRLFIEKTNLSPTGFSKEVGVNHESINRLFRNRDLLPSAIILHNAKKRFPKLNVNHILTGEDRMFLETVDTANVMAALEKELEQCKKSCDEKDETIGNLAATLRNMADKLKRYET